MFEWYSAQCILSDARLQSKSRIECRESARNAYVARQESTGLEKASTTGRHSNLVLCGVVVDIAGNERLESAIQTQLACYENLVGEILAAIKLANEGTVVLNDALDILDIVSQLNGGSELSMRFHMLVTLWPK